MKASLSALLLALGMSGAAVAVAQEEFSAELSGINEVPSVSSAASGEFNAQVDEAAGMVTWTLTYDALESPVQQAHLHFGEIHVAGGISVFLCTNLENGPPGTQTCPDPPAEITGTIMSADVIGPEEQGISAGEFEELLRALRAGAVYPNVHTETFPSGEIRGQLPGDEDLLGGVVAPN